MKLWMTMKTKVASAKTHQPSMPACRYVLSCGTSRITGLHRGTLDEVTAFATSCAEEFNLRSANGKGKAGGAYTKKKSLIPVAR